MIPTNKKVALPSVKSPIAIAKTINKHKIVQKCPPIDDILSKHSQMMHYFISMECEMQVLERYDVLETRLDISQIKSQSRFLNWNNLYLNKDK